MNSTYHIENIQEIDTPAVVVYPAIIRKNIEAALREGNIGSRNGLRPHVKTCKTLEIVQMMMELGITKFKCSTVSEAEMLGMAAAPDVLIAYQPSVVRAERNAKLRAMYPRTKYSCLVDNRYTTDMLSERFRSNPLAVYIDVNVGMNRTGISPGDATSLIRYCMQLKGIEVAGLHAYDGHVHEKDVVLRDRLTDAIYETVRDLKRNVLVQSGKTLTMVFGGSPTFSSWARREDAECSPGTFIFWDAGYSANFPDLPFLVAAMVITRIVSIVDNQRLCLDLGHKAIGSENPLPRVIFPDIPDVRVTGHSEEHMVVEVPDTSTYHIGDAWYGIPVHICPTIALHHTLHVIERNRFTKNWSVIARNRMINI